MLCHHQVWPCFVGLMKSYIYQYINATPRIAVLRARLVSGLFPTTIALIPLTLRRLLSLNIRALKPVRAIKNPGISPIVVFNQAVNSFLLAGWSAT